MADWNRLITETYDLVVTINARLSRIERILKYQRRETQENEMARREIDQALISEVHRNTDIVSAATTALTTLQDTNKDLVKKLEEALVDTDAEDDEEVQAALEELRANNDKVAAATPALAKAIANTNTSAPEPQAP